MFVRINRDSLALATVSCFTGRYLQFNIIMATIAIILSTAVLNFHHREIRRGKVPDILKKVREMLGEGHFTSDAYNTQKDQGPIHTGRGMPGATGCKQMGPVDVNGGVHTAR